MFLYGVIRILDEYKEYISFYIRASKEKPLTYQDVNALLTGISIGVICFI